MLIKCGDQVFDPNDVPCMVVLTPQDKHNIANMESQATRYASYPDKMAEEEVVKWMNDPRLPGVHQSPDNAISASGPCHDHHE